MRLNSCQSDGKGSQDTNHRQKSISDARGPRQPPTACPDSHRPGGAEATGFWTFLHLVYQVEQLGRGTRAIDRGFDVGISLERPLEAIVEAEKTVPVPTFAQNGSQEENAD